VRSQRRTDVFGHGTKPLLCQCTTTQWKASVYEDRSSQRRLCMDEPTPRHVKDSTGHCQIQGRHVSERGANVAFRCWLPSSCDSKFRQYGTQRVEVDWLCHMAIKPRCLGLCPVGFMAPASDGDER